MSRLIAKVKKKKKEKEKKKCSVKGKGELAGRLGSPRLAPFSLLSRDNYSQIRARICEVRSKRGRSRSLDLYIYDREASAIQGCCEISSS